MLKTAALSAASTVQQCPGNIVSDMDGEIVMMSIENGNYYNLGEMGSIIWDRIEQPITIYQLAENLSFEFDIGKEECIIQVISFLKSLKRENLIQISNQAAE